ncbi:MAG TPA: LCP family protein [Candidatus Saccharimonadales bacterium]|nr:LCP family protein [Candidatus Saccharimonadales bacterium]
MDIFPRPGKEAPERRVVKPVPIAGDNPAQPEVSKPTRFRFAKSFPVSWKKRLIVIGGGLVLAVGLFFGTKLVLAAKRIIAHNNGGGAPALAGNIDPTKLRGEGDGRINILLLGIGGQGWDGPYLSDTIMVLSIDPRTKDVAMLSIPRDLYVKIPGYGWSKINAADAYGESKKAGDGPNLTKQVVQQVLGIPIHYYVRVDFSGFKKAVDSVGGVDINVDKALYDPEYPGGTVNIKAGYQHMNGDTALKYARSRKTTSDFDRAARQQKLLLALRTKALSVKTLSNPAKIASLIDALGSSVRTDLQLSEMKKLAEIAQSINGNQVTNQVLDTTPNGLLVFGDIPGAGSIEIPRAGIGNYTEIQQLAHTIFADSYIKQENATVEVQNGTTQSGLATSVGNLLKSYNYNVISMVTADRQTYATTVIYDYTGGSKPYTINYLENRFGVRSTRANRGPSDPDIRIIVGASYQPPR